MSHPFSDPHQLLKDSNRELRILEYLKNHIHDETLKSLGNTYTSLLKDVIRNRLDESAKRYRARAVYLTGLASVAAFLASVQVGFIPVIGDPDCDVNPLLGGCSSHSRLIRDTIKFFSYLALSFDALGALFALMTARSLLRVSSQADDIMEDKYNLDGLILGQVSPNIANSSKVFEALTQRARDLRTRVLRHQHIMAKHMGGQYGVISFILLGMACFFIALILLVISNQSPGFWIPFVVLVGLMAILIACNEKRNLPRLWFHFRNWIRPKEEEDLEKDECTV